MAKASRFIGIAVFVLAPLPFGSADIIWICIWSLLLAFSLLTADLSPGAGRISALLLPLLVTVAIVGAMVILQQWPNPAIGLVDQAWRLPRDLLGLPAPDRISMTVSLPWLSFGYALLFAMAFMRAFLLATDAKGAHLLIRVLAWAVFCYALFGIAAQIFVPEMLLFREKEAYVGFATGTFVNRNTAATFWGSGALLFLVPLLRLLYRGVESKSPSIHQPFALLRHYLSSPLALGIGFTVCIVATAMTGSRAGLLLSIFAFLLSGALYLAPLRPGHLWRWGMFAGAAALSLVLLEQIGGIVAGRIVSYGLVDQQRLTAYRVSMAIIKDHPLFGVGLGNFEAAFSTYRLPGLGSLGIWDRAHSTPIELAVELGLPVTFLIITTILWYVYIMLRGSLLRRRDRYIPVIGAGVAALGILHTSVDFSLQIPGFGVFFAAVTGCGLAQSLPSSRERRIDEV